MPQYEYRCDAGHTFTRFDSVAAHRRWVPCDCGVLAEQIISVPTLVWGQPECRYDSPIDGTPITSWAQREDDLKRHGCREYDPEMKTDYQRRIKDGERQLAKSVSESVEEAVAKMPTAKRAKLHSELTEQGMDAQIERRTVEA